MEDADDLVERLLTAAAMIMEDSVEAALIRGALQTDARIELVDQAGQDIATLATAAAVLRRRWNSPNHLSDAAQIS